MDYPKFALVNNKKYKINTDFKTAIKCNEVYNSNVNDEEKTLAIIFLLFGDEGLKDVHNYEGLVEKATQFLLCNKEPIDNKNKKPDMDFEQDKGLIMASFYSDYNISNIYNIEMHWWQFCDLLNGLTEQCALNRVRDLRDFDISSIKDYKTKQKIIESQKAVALKEKEIELTEKEKENIRKFEQQFRKGE